MDITFKIISNKLLLTNYFPLAIINIHYTDYTDYRWIMLITYTKNIRSILYG